MTTSTNTYDLPNVEQRATGTRLRQLLRDAEAQGSLPISAGAESLHEQLQLLPSRALRDAVAKAFVALHRAGLHGTLTRDLGAEGQHWRVVGTLALDELDAREARALQELAAHPPAYLVAAIGRPERPGLDASAGQSPWLAVAGHIVAYRLQYGISDPTRALGAQPSQPLSLARETDWRFVLGEIRWSAGHLGGRLADPRVLGVFDPAGAVLPQHAVEALSGEPSARGRIARQTSGESGRFQATGCVSGSPVRSACSGSDPRIALRSWSSWRPFAEPRKCCTRRSLRVDLINHMRRGVLGPFKSSGASSLLDACTTWTPAIAGARRAWHQRAAWTTRHAEALVVGRLAAEELGLREHQALAALEEAPPQYLLAELGPPPAGTTGMKTWRHGAGLIERHRTCHEIGDPAHAFGSGRDPAARDHESLTRQQVDLVRGALQLGGDDRLALPEPPHRLLSGP